MKINKISDLQTGDVVRRPGGQALVVANVIGETAHLVRTEVVTVPADIEVVFRAEEVGRLQRLQAEIVELRQQLEATK